MLYTNVHLSKTYYRHISIPWPSRMWGPSNMCGLPKACPIICMLITRFNTVLYIYKYMIIFIKGDEE